MDGTMNSLNTDLSSWDILYNGKVEAETVRSDKGTSLLFQVYDKSYSGRV
jgi:hypothetical protein